MSIGLGGSLNFGTIISGPSDIRIQDLYDVEITSILNGQYLQYESATSKWKNVTLNVNLEDYVPLTLINVPNGVAPLNSSGQIPSSNLPSYVDDVLEYANFASLPVTGETGKIYITIDNNSQYRWSGSMYILLVSSPGTTDAVPEGSSNLYFTESRVRGTDLLGFTAATSGFDIIAADTVLEGFQKLQGKVTSLDSLKANLSGATFTGEVTAPSFNTTSSIRYKTNIKEIEFDLESFMKLKPVSYNKIGLNREEIGFIAEEINELYPNFVYKNEKGVIEGLDYSKMVSLLTKAIQYLLSKEF